MEMLEVSNTSGNGMDETCLALDGFIKITCLN